MDTSRYADAIEDLMDDVASKTRAERVQIYAAVKTLITEVDDYAEEKGKRLYISQKTSTILGHARSIAGLDDGNGDPVEQHASWVRLAARSLKAMLGKLRSE